MISRRTWSVNLYVNTGVHVGDNRKKIIIQLIFHEVQLYELLILRRRLFFIPCFPSIKRKSMRSFFRYFLPVIFNESTHKILFMDLKRIAEFSASLEACMSFRGMLGRKILPARLSNACIEVKKAKKRHKNDGEARKVS